MSRVCLAAVPPEMAAYFRRLIAQGWSIHMIARELGWRPATAYTYCARQGIALPGARSDAARAAARQRGFKKAVAVPRWVPASLRSEYRDFAADFGEEDAARRVRRLKHDMQAGGCEA